MTSATAMSAEEERLRPLYARVLRLRHVDPSGMLCFVFFEGTVAFGLLLALAELVNWWGVLILPATVAVMVKVNDMVAAAVVRSAARVPSQERERFRREIQPVIGRARVPGQSLAAPGWSADAAGSAVGAGGPGKPDDADTDRRQSGEPAAERPESRTSERGLPARVIPTAPSLNMTAVVRGRLERGRRSRPDQRPTPRWNEELTAHRNEELTPRLDEEATLRPDGRDAAAGPEVAVPDGVRPRGMDRTQGYGTNRSRIGNADRLGGENLIPPSTRDPGSPGTSARPAPRPTPDPNRAAGKRPEGGPDAADQAAGRSRPGSARSRPSELPALGDGSRLRNGRLAERLDQRPVRRWLDRLDPIDTFRQRARQSARRRYE